MLLVTTPTLKPAAHRMPPDIEQALVNHHGALLLHPTGYGLQAIEPILLHLITLSTTWRQSIFLQLIDCAECFINSKHSRSLQ